MSKKEKKDELLSLRLSKSRKDSLKASALRQNITLSKLIFSNLDTMKIKAIKEAVVDVIDNMKFIEGVDVPNFKLKDGSDDGNTDLQIIENLVLMLLDMTNKLNPQNQGVKGAIRKANGDFKPQQLDSHTKILRKLKKK